MNTHFDKFASNSLVLIKVWPRITAIYSSRSNIKITNYEYSSSLMQKKTPSFLQQSYPISNQQYEYQTVGDNSIYMVQK